MRPISTLSSCVLFLVVGAAACGDDGHPLTARVYVAAEAPEGVSIAADDVVSYLGRMGVPSTRTVASAAPRCARDELRVVFVGDGLGSESLPSEATSQTHRITESRCGSGALVELAGGGLLGRQYAAYEWLRLHGVRFFHPEHEFVPTTFAFTEPPIARTFTPSFRDRSVSLHTTHPLELIDVFRSEDYDPAYDGDGKRYIDWSVKNLVTRGRGGYGDGAQRDYGIRRGLRRESGLTLFGTQQGADGLLDPSDPIEVQRADLVAAIDASLDVPEDVRPSWFQLSFNVTEFTGVDPALALDMLTTATNHVTATYPGVEVWAIDHGTHQEPTPPYGIRYGDLPTLAPPELGILPHTLMFYDLERPAPVYGNASFAFFYDLMESQYRTRNLTYFPEAAWWLTFDNAVPLYLPITIEARDRDIQKIRHMLPSETPGGKLVGHHTFGTGHEWGYWQNEYCSLRLASDVSLRWQDCLREITGIFGPAADEAESVLESVVDAESEFMFDASVLRYLVGTDPETELAASIGIVLHPLPPLPEAIATWSQSDVDSFDRDVAPRLQAIEDAFTGFESRLAAVADQVPGAARPFFDEIADGIAMMRLRAAHQRLAYGALARLRASELAASSALRKEAEAMRDSAVAVTTEAGVVVARREAGYRYAPIDRAIAGGPDGTLDSNGTTYDYRYLNRVHHLYYYTLVDARVAAAFDAARETVSVDDAILGPVDSLVVRVSDPTATSVSVDYGDGTSESGALTYSHTYASVGAYDVHVTGTTATASIDVGMPVASVTSRTFTGFDVSVVAPSGASIIASIFPAIVYGPLDGDRIALGFTAMASGAVRPELWQPIARDTSATDLTSLPTDVFVPIVDRAKGTVYTRVLVSELVFVEDTTANVARLSGKLRLADVVQAMVLVGGGAFDEQGARSLVATTLGYAPDALPEYEAFVIEAGL